VAKINYVPIMTLWNMIKKHKEEVNGVARKRKSWSPPNKKITPFLEHHLLLHSSLQAWAGYSLGMRCFEIDKHFGILISVTTLLTFYKKHNIKMRYTNFQYR
jgi:hypothetical protein